MDPKKVSPENIESKMVTLNYETLSYENFFENKLWAKFDKYY